MCFFLQKTKRETDCRGVSTIELLMAFALIALVFAGVIATVVGNQSIALDTTLTSTALHEAEAAIEQGRGDFAESSELVRDDSKKITDSIFTRETSVDSYGCFTLLTEKVSWWENRPRNQAVTLLTLLADVNELAARGGDCITAPINDDTPWHDPSVLTTATLGVQGVTDIDVQGEYVYVSANSGDLSGDDLFVYEFSKSTLTPRGSINIEEGINAIDVAGNYLYAAHASTSNQLQIIDVENPDFPKWEAEAPLKDVDPFGSDPEGWSIYYYDNRVYVGTKETGTPPPEKTPSPEFHIFDVSIPSNPQQLGSLELTHRVQDIVVRDGWAYLATTDNWHELMVIDISDHGDLKHPDDTGFGFDITEADHGFFGRHDGFAVYVSGDKVYLGRKQNTPDASNDFFVLDISAVRGEEVATTTDGLLGSIDLELDSGDFVSDITVLSDFAFLAINGNSLGLQIWDVSDPTDIVPPNDESTFNFGTRATGVDVAEYDGNYYIFAVYENGEVQVIKDQDE